MTNYEVIIEEIKSLGLKEYSYSSDDENANEHMAIDTAFAIIKAINNDSNTKLERRESRLAAKIESGKTSIEKIIKVLIEQNRKANRTLHSFATLEEINLFKSKNECGKMWNDNGFWHIYKY